MSNIFQNSKLRKELFMDIQTFTFVQLSEMAEEVVMLGSRHHWRFRIITDFQGVIDKPVFNAQGDWVYMPMREEDKAIIPKLVYKQRATIERAGYRIAQEIIGHEVEIAVEKPNIPARPVREIDLGKIAKIAGKGFLAGVSGIATVAFYALTGAFMLFDPSYCIVLDDEVGTVVELLTWHTEV
jgi:hypothetical protein